MPKSQLHLSVETDLLELAKNMGINLSNEFENWIKIRVNQKEATNTKEELDLEIAKHKEAILMLENQNSEKERLEKQFKEEDSTISNIADNEIANKNKDMKWKQVIAIRASGIMAIWRRRFNKYLTMSQAITMLEEKLKAKGIDIDG